MRNSKLNAVKKITEGKQMRIVFISNFLNHHQTEFCKYMYEAKGINFVFIQMEQMPEERQQLGWWIDNEEYPYFIDGVHATPEVIKKMVCDADVIIYGDTNLDIFKMNLKSEVFILYYRERLFKKEVLWNVFRCVKLHYKYAVKNRKVNHVLLCASAYASADFSRIWAFGNQKYKWGYFPETRRYDVSELKKMKGNNDLLRILWAGRMILWKRTLDVLKLAKALREGHQRFRLDLIGTGECEESLKKFSIQNGLEDCVTFLGSLPHEQVRREMERADIFIMTSDYNEGWGVVLSEAMNSGCAVIVSHAVGSAPFLIQSGYNGFIYECGNVEEIYQCVKKCIENPELRHKLGWNAYLTILNEWNAEIAAERILKLIFRLKQRGNRNPVFDSGICSKAEEVRNNWWIQREV